MQTVLVLEVRDIPQRAFGKLEILYMLEAEEVVEFHAAILALEVQAEGGAGGAHNGTGNAGAANTGGGGGGGGGAVYGTAIAGGPGGSGVVLIRLK